MEKPTITFRSAGEARLTAERGWEVRDPGGEWRAWEQPATPHVHESNWNPMTRTFTVWGKPEPAGSKKAVPLGKQGRWGVVDANKNADRYKKTVGAVAFAAMNGMPPFEGPVGLRLTFVLARGANHWRKDGTLSAEGERRLHHTSKPDALKLARAVEDGMTGIVYVDDSQIVRERITKRYCATPTEEPHVFVEVSPL